MLITSKSIFQSNIVFSLPEKNFVEPENKDFAGIFEGEAAAGASFVDDPVMKLKVLNLPRLQIKAALEQNRLRIDDNSQLEPASSFLIPHALNVLAKLFPQLEPDAFGFNFDLIYKFNNAIPLEDFFGRVFEREILDKKNLRALGWQFTLDESGGKLLHTYFFKIVSPLELAVHYNRHFSGQKPPPEAELRYLFTESYNGVDEMVQKLKFH